MKFLLRLVRLILSIAVLYPILLVCFISALWSSINDAYETAVIGDIIASLPDQNASGRTSWITPDGNIALRTGQLTAGAPYNPYTGARYQGCVAILLAKGSNHLGTFKADGLRQNDEVDTFFSGTDPRVGGISLDATFLNNRLLKGEKTQEDIKNYKRVFGDCKRECVVEVTCIKPQMVTVLADLDVAGESSAQLVYPPLPEKEYPLLQYGRLAPAAYQASYLKQLPELAMLETKTMSLAAFIMAVLLLILGQKRRSLPAYVMATPLLLPWLSYYAMAWPPVSTLLLLTATASFALTLMTTGSGLKLRTPGDNVPSSRLLRDAEKALYTPGPMVAPRSSTSTLATPSALQPAPAMPLPPASHPEPKTSGKKGGLAEKAISELLERLNPLTLSALSPGQLETTVLNHLQRTHDSEIAALTRDELQQLVQQLAKTLASKAQSVRK